MTTRTLEVRSHTFTDGNLGLQLVGGRGRILLNKAEAVLMAGLIIAALEAETEVQP